MSDKRAVIRMDGDEYINIPADSIDVVDDLLLVEREKQLVAVVRMTAVVSAHLS